MSPFVMIIFGATGDLAKSKLFPALFSLYKKGDIGEPSFAEASKGKQFYIVGFARRPYSDDEFRNFLKENITISSKDETEWDEFLQNVHYQQGTFEEDKGYNELITRLNDFDQKIGACITRLFYLATPPNNYETILDMLKVTKLSEGCGPASAYLASRSTSTQARSALAGNHGSNKWTKLIIEKPFGKDLETAKVLDMKLCEIFEEKQIFRVDHYLGKETVQNIIAFRFANGIFDPVWNKNYLDHVQITLAEKEGISGRGKFFDGVGMLRDVGQNHLLQLAAAVAMEQPKSFSKEGLRDARTHAIQALQCIEPQKIEEFVVRGQYAGYTNEKDVSKDSSTETFAAMKVFFETERFSGVPFYLRAGKKMPKDTVEISLVFIQTCHLLFKEYGCPEIGNVLTIRVQPDEGIGLRVIAKKPGTKLSLGTVDMKFSYAEEFGGKGADAYEKLLLDILNSDQMLFNRSDELESSWEFITKVLEGWQKLRPPLFSYEPGTWGPTEAEQLIEKDGKKWL